MGSEVKESLVNLLRAMLDVPWLDVNVRVNALRMLRNVDYDEFIKRQTTQDIFADAFGKGK